MMLDPRQEGLVKPFLSERSTTKLKRKTRPGSTQTQEFKKKKEASETNTM